MSKRGNSVELPWEDNQVWSGSVNTDGIYFNIAEFQIISATGGPWTPQRSLDGGITWDSCLISDQLGNSYASIITGNVSKIFKIEGRACLKLLPTSDSDAISLIVSFFN